MAQTTASRHRRPSRLHVISFRLDAEAARALEELESDMPDVRGRTAVVLRKLVRDAHARLDEIDFDSAKQVATGPHPGEKIDARQVFFGVDDEDDARLEQIEERLPATVTRGRTSVVMRLLLLDAREQRRRR